MMNRILVACAFAMLALPAMGQDATVSIKNFMFEPMNVEVSAGSTVTWQNNDEEPHTVTSEEGLFRSGGIDGGAKFSFRFEKPGVYKYVCSIHPQMVGTVTVK
ncbi:MAG TPA: cupredoxin family copper-binding protein [Rhizomicrobium sp.]|nr:cupredoxin family copper-binding protein [Rhizomicrobium sp.]